LQPRTGLKKRSKEILNFRKKNIRLAALKIKI
jgi:hypothetical protein